jgi:DNA-binding transcriptional LysR family regulator
MSDVRQLRAEELSFTRAARKIPLAQSALSASVRSLERTLHAQLFNRTGQAVTLTEAGEVLLVEARKILRAMDEAQDAVAEVAGGFRGTLRLGILQAARLPEPKRHPGRVPRTATADPTGGAG